MRTTPWLPHHDGASVSELESDDGLGEQLQVSIEGDEDGLGLPAAHSCLWSDRHLDCLNRPRLMQHSCSKD